MEIKTDTDNIKIEKSTVAVVVICGICMFTVSIVLLDQVEWQAIHTVVASIPIILLPYLHGRLKARREQFERDMRVSLRQFEERLKRK